MEDIKKYVGSITAKFDFEKIKELLNSLKHLNVLVIGDTIIDQYTFVAQKGRAIKDPIPSAEYLRDEHYAGGILAIANHLSDFVNKIKLITLIGDKNPLVDLIEKSAKINIELKTFVKKNSPTTIKRRMIDFYRGTKLFKVEYINDKPITEELTQEINQYLEEQLPKYNLVIVGDFGHGFINAEIRRKLEKKSKFLALNVQTNSANMGYNYFNLYNRFDFISFNEPELRLPLSMRFEEINEIIDVANSKFQLNNFIITRGKSGCVFVNKGNIFKSPILIESVKDTIGSGDAVFSITALLSYIKADSELIPFIANSAGGIASNILGNKESISKEKLLSFIKGVYEDGVGRL